jgi:histidinol-phosphate/aromatic aminotransferase/cobyric acid decarboxylase-like protein
VTVTAFHGGAFFEAIGVEFDDLARRHDVISADVLDAWFDPAPAVTAAIHESLAWSMRTSPPTRAHGMQRVIARARGVDERAILPGAGSSDLIFLALRHWLTRASRVLILDPMYGEYAHVLERVIGCRVDRLPLARDDGYALDVDALAARLRAGYDAVCVVNPNSPTGCHAPRAALERVLRDAPERTLFWIDETYVDYVGPGESLETFAAASNKVVVCKSMSKAYALSGLRAAYLCGPASRLDELREISPPWSVSLPAQIAACAALHSAPYYEARWRETHALRLELAGWLTDLGWHVLPGCANFLLCELPPTGPSTATIVADCRRRNLFLRDVSSMGRSFDGRVLRVAVKDAATNARMVDILRCALAAPSAPRIRSAAQSCREGPLLRHARPPAS